jgi:hypothetical protein
MLFNEEWFVQLLEGDKADVRTTFDRIAMDSRHEEVQIIFEGVTAERRMTDWSMAFVGDAAAIRKRFPVSPLATPRPTMRGYQVVDYVVGLCQTNVAAGAGG